MADDRVEILIRARDEATATLNNAIRSVVNLNNATSKAGAIARVNFGQVGSALSLVSPAASQAAFQLEQVRKLTAGFGSVASTVATVAGGLSLAIAGVGAAAFAASKNLADKVERLDNLSAATGTSIQNLQVLGETFRRAGLGAEAGEDSLIRLNKAIAEGNPLLAKLGVTAKDPALALLQLSEAFRTSTDEAAKTKVAFELMGRGSKDVLKIIDGLSAQFPELRDEMAKTGQLLSTDMVEAGRKFDAEWDRFTGRWEGFTNRIGGAAATAANAVIDAFQAAGAATSRFFDFLKNPAAAANRLKFDAMAQGAGAYADALEQVGAKGAPAVDKVTAALAKADKSTRSLHAIAQDLLEVYSQIPTSIERRQILVPEERLQPSGPVEEELAARGPRFAESIEQMEAARRRITNMLDEIGSVASLFEGTVSASFFGVADAFGVITDRILAGGNVFKLQFVEIFHSMISAAIAEFNRFAASKVVRFFLSLFGGPVGQVLGFVGSAAGGGGGLTPHSLGAAASGATAGGGAQSAARNVELNLNVNALDSKSFQDFMQSPLGAGYQTELRRASSRTI